MADSLKTALYVSLFRREVRSCHFSPIEQRALVSFEIVAAVRLVDLRGLEAHYPVLQSMRDEISQAFAQACHKQGLHGVLYASAWHPSTPVIAVCAFSAWALTAPGSWRQLRWCSRAPGCCTRRWYCPCVGRRCKYCRIEVASLLIAASAINTGDVARPRWLRTFAARRTLPAWPTQGVSLDRQSAAMPVCGARFRNHRRGLASSRMRHHFSSL